MCPIMVDSERIAVRREERLVRTEGGWDEALQDGGDGNIAFPQAMTKPRATRARHDHRPRALAGALTGT
jgi:hypothetical protein